MAFPFYWSVANIYVKIVKVYHYVKAWLGHIIDFITFYSLGERKKMGYSNEVPYNFLNSMLCLLYFVVLHNTLHFLKNFLYDIPIISHSLRTLMWKHNNPLTQLLEKFMNFSPLTPNFHFQIVSFSIEIVKKFICNEATMNL